MSNDYLKKDFERVNRKFEDLMYEGEIEVIEKKIDALDKNPETTPLDKIWKDIYDDVLDLKKKKHNKE